MITHHAFTAMVGFWRAGADGKKEYRFVDKATLQHSVFFPEDVVHVARDIDEKAYLADFYKAGEAPITKFPMTAVNVCGNTRCKQHDQDEQRPMIWVAMTAITHDKAVEIATGFADMLKDGWQIHWIVFEKAECFSCGAVGWRKLVPEEVTREYSDEYLKSLVEERDYVNGRMVRACEEICGGLWLGEYFLLKQLVSTFTDVIIGSMINDRFVEKSSSLKFKDIPKFELFTDFTSVSLGKCYNQSKSSYLTPYSLLVVAINTHHSFDACVTFARLRSDKSKQAEIVTEVVKCHHAVKYPRSLCKEARKIQTDTHLAVLHKVGDRPEAKYPMRSDSLCPKCVTLNVSVYASKTWVQMAGVTIKEARDIAHSVELRLQDGWKVTKVIVRDVECYRCNRKGDCKLNVDAFLQEYTPVYVDNLQRESSEALDNGFLEAGEDEIGIDTKFRIALS